MINKMANKLLMVSLTALSVMLSGCLSTSVGIGPVRIPVYTPAPEKKKPPPEEQTEEQTEEESETDEKPPVLDHN